MANGKKTLECQEEIARFADDLILTMRCVIHENEKDDEPATHIVIGDENFYVHVYWTLTGKLARHFCGKWKVKIDLESIGTAPEYTSKPVIIDMDPCKEGEYYHMFVIGPRDLQPNPGGTVYIPAVTLTSIDPCGGEGHMWGYCVGSSVMFTLAVPE